MEYIKMVWGGAWDAVQTYSTTPTVQIKHAFLGIACKLMYLVGVVVALLLLLTFQMFYEGVVPEGSVRINPMAPIQREGGSWAKIEDLSYCKTENRTELYGYKLYPCKYFDAPINVFPQAIDSSVSITTRIKNYTQHASNPEFDTPDTVWITETNNTFYLADIENFTLKIDHSFIVSLLDRSYNSYDLAGKIVDWQNKTMKPKPGETIGVKNKSDIIFVSTLLEAAHVDIDKESANGQEPIRYSGAVFMVYLEYRNSNSKWLIWGNNEINYTIRVKRMNHTEYKAEQAVYTKQLDKRTMYNRHSLHFVFVPSGQLMYTDWFKVLTAASWLVTVYSVIVVVFDLFLGTCTETCGCCQYGCGCCRKGRKCYCCRWCYGPCRVVTGRVKYKATKDLCSCYLCRNNPQTDECECCCCECKEHDEYKNWANELDQLLTVTVDVQEMQGAADPSAADAQNPPVKKDSPYQLQEVLKKDA